MYRLPKLAYKKVNVKFSSGRATANSPERLDYHCLDRKELSEQRQSFGERVMRSSLERCSVNQWTRTFSVKGHNLMFWLRGTRCP